MQEKTNVLDYPTVAARIGERHVAELKSLANRAGCRDGVRRRTNGGLHGEKLEEVLQEDRLLGNVVEAGEDLLDVGSRSGEGPRQEGKAAEGNPVRKGSRSSL